MQRAKTGYVTPGNLLEHYETDVGFLLDLLNVPKPTTDEDIDSGPNSWDAES